MECPCIITELKNFINNPNIQRLGVINHQRKISDQMWRGFQICLYIEFSCGTEKRDAVICKEIVLFTWQFYQLDINVAEAAIKKFRTKHYYSANEEAAPVY